MFLYQTPGETAGPPPEDDFQMAAPDSTGELSGSESVAEEPEEEHHEVVVRGDAHSSVPELGIAVQV